MDPDVAAVLAHAARSAHRHGWEEESRDLAAWARAQWAAFGRLDEADRLDAELALPRASQ
jgi:hypothetical protein